MRPKILCRRVALAALQPRLERRGVAFLQPGEGAPHRLLATRSCNVLRQRPMGEVGESSAVEPGKEITGIAKA